ncbi:MAG: hypothetical protein LBS60_09880 [Deltaproteobacteria bacterium]|jgi:hypothetical protein|nr:hypothetical protein [Deltaproteobacteria bacterium]
MKKVIFTILALCWLSLSQVAMAWDWPFFGEKKADEPTLAPVATPVPSESLTPEPALESRSLDLNSYDFDGRLKFVVRSYAQTYNIGSDARIDFDGTLVETRGQAMGLAVEPTEFLKLYAEYQGLNQTAESSFGVLDEGRTAYGSGLVVGSEFNFKGLTAGLKYFDLSYRLEPLRAVELASLRAPSEDYRTRGLEFTAAWDMDQTFNWDFELRPFVTLTRSFEQPNNRFPRLGQRDPGLRFSYGLVFNHEKSGLSMSFEAYQGQRAPSSLYYPFPGDNVSDSPIYDFHLAKRLYDWPDQGRLSLKADVTNIGGAPGGNQRSNNEEGRTFKTGLRYEY